MTPEGTVADGKCFIDDQYVGFDAGRNRKRQTHEHTARVGFHGLIDVYANTCELDDRIDPAIYLSPGQAERGRIQIDVLAACEFRVEAGTELQNGGYASIGMHRSVSRGDRACNQLQQRGLSGAVDPDDAHDFAAA